ncbi:MAG TPA: hypothetical protein VMG32_09755 [Anaeromyxobacteraceae bacterium]|nr:hypothetical protein [Anaeromyxobacteraceae bacterium]
MRASRLLFACALFLPGTARSDSITETRLRDALRASAQRVEALEEERAQGQAREAALKEELAALRQEASALKRAPPPVKCDCGPAERRATALEERLADGEKAAQELAASLTECQNAARAGDEAARAKERDRAALAAEVRAVKERLSSCQAKNERMFRVGEEVIDWLAHMGMGAAIAAREPFLGLKRVELENAAQDYQDRLLEQKVKP